MGGVNHQPCRYYLPQSTQLSQRLSDLVAACHVGNSQIEEIIIGELTNDRGRTARGMTAAIGQFTTCETTLDVLLTDLDALFTRMDELEFQDSPSAKQIDLDLLERSFVEQGMIPPNSAAWRAVVSAYRKGGFRVVFAMFRERFSAVQPAVNEVKSVLTRGAPFAAEAKFNVEVERNGLPLRQSYNCLLTAVGVALEEFRCSSLLSTELHLMDMGHSTFVTEAHEFAAR